MTCIARESGRSAGIGSSCEEHGREASKNIRTVAIRTTRAIFGLAGDPKEHATLIVRRILCLIPSLKRKDDMLPRCILAILALAILANSGFADEQQEKAD